MKKTLAIILALAMLVTMLAGCTEQKTEQTQAPAADAPAAEASAENVPAADTAETSASQKKIGLAIQTLTIEYFTDLQASIEESFGALGYEVITASAEMDVSKQVTDIENLVAMGCEMIIVGAVDMQSAQDTCAKAREAGVKILAMQAFENPDAYDAMLGGSSNLALGQGTAELAAEWVDTKFPDAEDGTIEAVLITNPSNQDMLDRIEGFNMAPEFSSKIKIVHSYEMASNDPVEKTQELAIMALTQYPNLKVIFCSDASFAIAINETLMGYGDIDISEVGIFSVGSSQTAHFTDCRFRRG